MASLPVVAVALVTFAVVWMVVGVVVARLVEDHLVVPGEGATQTAAVWVPDVLTGFAQPSAYGVLALAAGIVLMCRAVYGRGRV